MKIGDKQHGKLIKVAKKYVLCATCKRHVWNSFVGPSFRYINSNNLLRHLKAKHPKKRWWEFWK